MLGDYAPLFQILGNEEHAARRKALSSTVSHARIHLRFLEKLTDDGQYAMRHALMLEDVVDQRVLELNEKLKINFADSGARFDWAEWNR